MLCVCTRRAFVAMCGSVAGCGYVGVASFPGQKGTGPSVPVITSPAILPNAEVSANYSFQFTATGGKPPYTWNPPSVGNFTLSPGGLLFNTAALTAGSTFNFSITVTDSVGAATTQGFQLTTLRAPTITTVSPLPTANAGIPYSVTFAARDGTPPYTWAATSGLPSWATLDPVAGTLSGTPVGAETDSITIQATDSYATPVSSAPTAFSLTVQAGVGPTGPPQALWRGQFDSSSLVLMAWPPLTPVTVNFTTPLAVGATGGTLATAINPGTYAFTFTGTGGAFGPEYHNTLVAADGVTCTFNTNGNITHAQTSGPGGVAQIHYDAVDGYNYYINGVKANSFLVLNSPLVSFGSLMQPWFSALNLTPNTTYVCTARAVLNGVESVDSPSVTITTLPLNTPTTLPTTATPPETWVQPNTPPAATPVSCTTQAQFVAALAAVNLNGPNIIKLQSNTTFAGTAGPAWTLPALNAGGSLWIVSDQVPEINASGTLIPYDPAFPRPDETAVLLSVAPTAGATAATLAPNQTGLTDASGNWLPKSGAYWTHFYETTTNAEEERLVLYTKGSNALSWPTNLNGVAPLVNACIVGIRVEVLRCVTPCPTDLAAMATLQMGGAANTNGIVVPPACNNVRFIGIRLIPLPGAPQASTGISFPLNPFGATPVVNPNHIYFDRCMIGMSTADPSYTFLVHGIALNCDHFLCNQTYFQGICTFNGAGDANCFFGAGGGPHCFQNVHFEATAEGGIYGGVGVFPQSNQPHDITVRGCFFIKPTMWLTMAPPSAGVAWSAVSQGTVLNLGYTIKNHFELKHAVRVSGYNNVGWNSWTSKQAGQFGAWNIGPLEQASGGQFPITMACPWSEVSDIDIHDNDMTCLQRVVQMHGGDVCAVGKSARYRFANNRSYINPFIDPVQDKYNYYGITTGSVTDFTIDHNTMVVNNANPQNASPSLQATIYNTQTNLPQPNLPYTPNPRQVWLDRATITNNILGGNAAVYSQNLHGTAAINSACNPANVVYTNNVEIEDANAYPAGNPNLVPLANLGLRNWNPLSTSAAVGFRPQPRDWDVVSGTYATFSTTNGPIGAISAPLPVITTPSLAAATVGVAYSQPVAISGGTGPYTLVMSGAPLRGSWLTVNQANNGLQGTPQYNETNTVSLQAFDSQGAASVVVTLPLVVAASGALSVVTASLTNQSVGSLAQWQMIAKGGVPPYVWGTPSALAAANLTFPAAGYTLEPNGFITAVPTATASTGLAAMTVTDSTGATATSTSLVNVVDNLLRFDRIDSVDGFIRVPDAHVGTKYGALSPRFSAAGGSGTLTFSLASGTLPTGLSIGTTGTLNGTVGAAVIPGTYYFTVQVADTSSNTATALVHMKVLPAVTIPRPAYNTSTSWYVAQGQLVDPSTNRPFIMRGFNRDHFDQPSNTLPKPNVSAIRNTTSGQGIAIASYINDFNNNGIAFKILPIWSQFFTAAGAKISGTTDPTTIGQLLQYLFTNFSSLSPFMDKIICNWANEWGGFGGSTAAQINAAYLGVTANISNISGTTITVNTVSATNPFANSAWAFVKGAGTNANQVVNLSAPGGSSGAWTVTSSVSLSAATTGTLNAGIAGMRAAGFTWPVMIDSPGGQNWPNLSAVALGIQQSDPMQNCIFSYHAYNDSTATEVQIKSVAISGTNTILTFNALGSQFLGSGQNSFKQFVTGGGNFSSAFGISVAGAPGPWAAMNGHYFLASQGAGFGGASPNWTVTIPFNAAAAGLTAATYVANSAVAFDDGNPIDWCARRAADRANNLCWVVGEFGPFGHYGIDNWTVLQPLDVIQAGESYGIGTLYWAWDDERSNPNGYAMVVGTTTHDFTNPQSLNPQSGQAVIAHPRLSYAATASAAEQLL